MKFYESFGLGNGDVVCLTGAGGKTSLMFKLAEEMQNDGFRVLITTTTRLGMDEIKEGFDFFVNIDGEMALSPEISEIKERMSDYDVILIEADGSACKPLKGWRENEPVIPDFTTLTIDVIDISVIGKIADETIVHRHEIFTDITGTKMGEEITHDTIARIAEYTSGDIIFLNKCESKDIYDNADKVASKIKRDVKIYAGSIYNDELKVLKR